MAESLTKLDEALASASLPALVDAWQGVEEEQQARVSFLQYTAFLDRIRSVSPEAMGAVTACEGNSTLSARLSEFPAAWDHRRASTWLQRVSNPKTVAAIEREVASLRERIERTVGDVTIERAWLAALNRINDPLKKVLVAWHQAVSRLTKPGSKSYFDRRAAARGYLKQALQAIPAWVVSLPSLYETVLPKPGLFDLAIVDEASQCSLDALIIFYLSKQVIVVGDEKQISPIVVGLREGDDTRLANAMLPGFQFASSFTLDSSLFSHAKRCFTGGTVVLREHFRCVPEIIRFSNNLCYDDRLVPLRRVEQPRLAPLRTTYVASGNRVRDRNEPEALNLVETLLQCHADPAYEGKDFGVICLQGHDQADRIKSMLIERAGPTLFTERRLRCGEPPAFQGDERDVIFLSMVAAPNTSNATLSVGRRMYQQRFNVALSRARDQFWLFHSVTRDEVSPDCLRRRVLDYFLTPPPEVIEGADVSVSELQRLLLRADRTREEPPHPFDSWFEVDVAVGLSMRGHRVRAQVPAGHHRIDLVLGHGGTQLAVECDGDAFHGIERLEQDTHRQRQLERAGWTFVRIRGSEYCHDPQAALRRVDAAWEELAGEDEDWAQGAVAEGAPVVVPNGHAIVPTQQAPAERHGASVERGAPSSDLTYVDGAELEEFDDSSRDEDDLTADGFARSAADGDPRGEPFTGYAGKQYPNPKTASVGNIREAVLEVVTLDGPLPKKAVYALYRDGCPDVERAAKYLRSAVNRALAYLERIHIVETIDEGGTRRPEDVVIRRKDQPAVRIRPRGRRGFDDIPLSELWAVMNAISNGRSFVEGVEQDQVFRSTLERYGFKTLTASVRERLTRAIQSGTAGPS